MELNQEMATLDKDYRYDEVVDLIESIGYKQRVGNYYFIREDDGYINISYGHDKKVYRHLIRFHKNFSPPYPHKDISKNFDNFESFLEFITEYHKPLFMKHKIKKIINGISNDGS